MRILIYILIAISCVVFIVVEATRCSTHSRVPSSASSPTSKPASGEASRTAADARADIHHLVAFLRFQRLCLITVLNTALEQDSEKTDSRYYERALIKMSEILSLEATLYEGVVKLAGTDWKMFTTDEMVTAAANAAAVHREFSGAIQSYNNAINAVPNQEQAAAISIQAAAASIILGSGVPLMKAQEDCSRLSRSLEDSQKVINAGPITTENANDAFEQAIGLSNHRIGTSFISLTADLKSCTEEQVGDYAVLIMKYLHDCYTQADVRRNISVGQAAAFSILLKDVAESHPALLRNAVFDEMHQRASDEVQTLLRK